MGDFTAPKLIGSQATIMLAMLWYDFIVPPNDWLVRHPLLTGLLEAALLMDTANYEMSSHTAARKNTDTCSNLLLQGQIGKNLHGTSLQQDGCGYDAD